MKIFYCDGSTRGGKNQKGAENIGGWGAVCFLDEDENCLVAYDYETKLRVSLDVMLKLLEPTMMIIVGIIALIVSIFGYKHFNEMFTQAFF